MPHRAPSRHRFLLTAALLLAGMALPARAEPMHVLETSPRARTTMDGTREEFFVRFDAPVDHNGSRLLVLQEGRVLRTLHPRLNASPDTLYAAAGGLPPGSYTLRWEAKSRRDGSMTEGSLEFTVR